MIDVCASNLWCTRRKPRVAAQSKKPRQFGLALTCERFSAPATESRKARESRIAAGARRRDNPRPVASTLGLVTEHGAGRN